jgi:SAM-dependent methyltransferase
LLPAPFSSEYNQRHRAVVSAALASDGLLARFADVESLPRRYGVGLDERVVEYPWTLAQRPHGRVLDAGSALNHAHILDRFLPSVADLHIVTLAPEPMSFPERGVSYAYADLRELPFPDESFDAILSISTLEHVGMDNSRYGAAPSRQEDPKDALQAALSELKRVLAPDGMFLATIPYGQREDHGWFRQFGHDDVEELVDALDARLHRLAVYSYSPRGWQLSSLDAARNQRYHDLPDPPAYEPDLAAAARAVVCLRAER